MWGGGAAMNGTPLSQATVSEVRQRLDKITAASLNPSLDLRNLRAVLIDLLDSVEHDPAIDAAVDELSEAAGLYLEEVERAAAMQTEAGDRAIERRFKNITRARRRPWAALFVLRASPRRRVAS
jgi:hypothetical protein